MIEDGVIKYKQLVFISSQPPDKALLGFVIDVDYPIISVLVIPRSGSKNKFGKIQKIDISKDIALTVLTDDFIKEYLTPKEKKYFVKLKNEVVDLFEGCY